MSDKSDIVERLRLRCALELDEQYLCDAIECEAADEIERLRAEIARLREERRWVPVGERLPEDNVGVLAWGPCNGGAEMVWREHGKWHLSFVGTYIPDSTYTHWQPLPTGPEVHG